MKGNGPIEASTTKPIKVQQKGMEVAHDSDLLVKNIKNQKMTTRKKWQWLRNINGKDYSKESLSISQKR